MNLLRMTLRNFKSFEQEASIDFMPMSPGLYYVAGQNEVTPSLGSNGAGKSTLFEAWFWCLYGKTPGNLKAGDISSRLNKGTVHVQIEFTLTPNSPKYRLTREWSPNALVLQQGAETEQTVSQADLQDIIGITYHEFTAAVLLGQGLGKEHFFDKTPSEKLALLQETLGLGVWVDWSKEADKLLTETTVKISMHKMRHARLLGRKEELESDIKANQAHAQAFEEQQQERIKLAEAELRTYIHQVKGDKKRYRELVKEENLSLVIMQKSLAQYDRVKKQQSELNASLRSAEKILYAADQGVKQAKEARSRIEELGAVCQTCQQVINESHRHKHRDLATTAIGRATTKRNKAKKKVQELCQHGTEFDAMVKEQDDLCEKYEKRYNDVKAQADRLSHQLQEVHPRCVKSLHRRVKEIQAESSSSQTQLQASTEHHQQVCEEIKVLTSELDTCQTMADDLVYWVKGFKDIRLFLMDEAVSTLEDETNRALAELGMSDWRVRFDVEREKKTGGITKGFTVQVFPPDSDHSYAWEAYSGGETQRLRLAGRVGLSNMIFAARHLSPGVEVWDEPTQYLSEQGIEDIKESLRQRANVHGLKIFLVDHRAYDFSGFESKITVVKDQRGSRIEYG